MVSSGLEADRCAIGWREADLSVLMRSQMAMRCAPWICQYVIHSMRYGSCACRHVRAQSRSKRWLAHGNRLERGCGSWLRRCKPKLGLATRGLEAVGQGASEADNAGAAANSVLVASLDVFAEQPALRSPCHDRDAAQQSLRPQSVTGSCGQRRAGGVQKHAHLVQDLRADGESRRRGRLRVLCILL